MTKIWLYSIADVLFWMSVYANADLFFTCGVWTTFILLFLLSQRCLFWPDCVQFSVWMTPFSLSVFGPLLYCFNFIYFQLCRFWTDYIQFSVWMTPFSLSVFGPLLYCFSCFVIPTMSILVGLYSVFCMDVTSTILLLVFYSVKFSRLYLYLYSFIWRLMSSSNSQSPLSCITLYPILQASSIISRIPWWQPFHGLPFPFLTAGT